MRIIAVIVIAALALVGLYYFAPDAFLKNGSTATTTQSAARSYSNADVGLSFQYPDTYVLTERDGTVPGEDIERVKTITLMDKTAAANIPEGGEGPTSIAFEVFVYDHATSSLEGWIRETQQSNFQLSTDSTITPRSVAGTTSLEYTWDGLYRGRSVVIPHGDHIIVASVTMFEPSDTIASDFEQILRTLELE